MSITKINTIHVADVQRGLSHLNQAHELLITAMGETGTQRVLALETARTMLSFAHEFFGLAGQDELVAATHNCEAEVARMQARVTRVAA